jgi:hypothetical protein
MTRRRRDREIPVAAMPLPSSTQRIAYAVRTGSDGLASRAKDDRRLGRERIGSSWVTTASTSSGVGPHHWRSRWTSVRNGGFVMLRTIAGRRERRMSGG